MTLRVVRLGNARQRGEGLRIGTVRRPPRGVRKSDYARRNIGKAARAAKRKRTISHLPKKTRRALGKQGAKVAKRKRKKR